MEGDKMNKNRTQKTNMLLAVCFVAVNLLIQVIGYVDYGMLPRLFWSLSDCIIIMMPLLFGLAFGLICMLPMAVAEVIWYAQLLSAGPLLQIASFFVVVCICAVLFRLIITLKAAKRALLTGVIFEIGLWAESLLYHWLRYLFIPSHQAVTWKAISESFLNPANPLVLCIGLVCILRQKQVQE